jgi:hypothetical protein
MASKCADVENLFALFSKSFARFTGSFKMALPLLAMITG